MNRLTEVDDQGNWNIKGLPWKDTYVGQTITKNTSEKIHEALYKLFDYEETGLAPDEISDGIAKMLKAFNEYIEHGWIPCSERLPEDRVNVLVCYEGEVDIDFIIEGKWFFGGDTENVIAWMPLPELYKPKKQPKKKADWRDAMMRTFLGGRT